MIEIKNPLSAAKVIGPLDAEHVEAYHASSPVNTRGQRDHIMSFSALKYFVPGGCPRKWFLGHELDDTDDKDWGTMQDRRMSRQSFLVKPETYPDAKTGEAKPWSGNSNWCKDWLAHHEGEFVVSHKINLLGEEAFSRLMADETVGSYVEASQKQVYLTTEYQDEATGLTIPLKCLLDLVPASDHPTWGKTLGDFKTTTCAAGRAWKNRLYEFGYYMQGALYLDAWTLATGEDRQDFRHIVQESKHPWHFELSMLSQEWIELGRLHYLTALRRYCQCVSTGKWPGYYGEDTLRLAGFFVTNPDPWMVQ